MLSARLELIVGGQSYGSLIVALDGSRELVDMVEFVEGKLQV